MWQRLKEAWRELGGELFDADGLGTVFQHARNVLTGTMIIAAGLYAAHHRHSVPLPPGMSTVPVAGYGVATIGGILLVLNLIDGLRRLAHREHHVALRAVVILVYVVLSARLSQVIMVFRTGL